VVVKRILIKEENKLRELNWQNTNAKEDVWQSIKNVSSWKEYGSQISYPLRPSCSAPLTAYKRKIYHIL